MNLSRLVNPTERQREFLDAIAKHDFVLYEGEGGGGKSYILRWWLVLFLIWTYKALGLRHVRVGMFSKDYPTLRDRQISKMRVEFPRGLGELKKAETWNFTLREEYGGGELALRNLDDPAKYKSTEFAAMAVEELTENPLSVFNDLRWRLRWPGIERPKFAAGTNPGNIGHEWVKRYWITKKYPAELERKRDEFVRVRAKSSDNPHLPTNYHADLLTLPPEMARRVGHGDWNVYTGQYFPQFEDLPGRHVISAKDAMALVKPWHTKWISGDWGDAHPSCFHWHARDEHNRIVTYREMWGPWVKEQEWARRITAASYGEKLAAFPFSWDAGRQSRNTPAKYPRSVTQLLSESLGDGIPKPHPTDSTAGSRMSGFRLMAQLLDANLWKISDACPKLIECLPSLLREEDDPETVLKVDYAEGDSIGDDPADSARYGLQYMMGSAVKPKQVALEERFQAVRRGLTPKDPNNTDERAAPHDPFAKFRGKKL